MIDFSKKVVVITGGSSGMGRAFAKELVSRNAQVIILARNKEKLQKVVADLKTTPKSIIGMVCDVAEYDMVKKAIAEVVSLYGRVDMVLNAAGVGMYKPVQETSMKEFHDVMNINYFGTVNVVKEVLPIMLKQKSGIIVNISSVAGKGAFPWITAYAGSKFAVAGFTEGLYYDVNDQGIKVLLICPGAVNTNFFNTPSFKNFPHETRHKNMIEPEEVVRVTLKELEKKSFETFIPKFWKIKYIARIIIPGIFMKKVNALPR